ncbi:hypothetical protein [Brevibacillus massiliensis]|uniref:hypothetical protein n=1 Tax=Brevibacillus massiliensis TaxID=1118054 RepID=UPI0012B643A8|nr:hypothetical protein [Brevibacillus massiliensis]
MEQRRVLKVLAGKYGEIRIVSPTKQPTREEVEEFYRLAARLLPKSESAKR